MRAGAVKCCSCNLYPWPSAHAWQGYASSGAGYVLQVQLLKVNLSISVKLTLWLGCVARGFLGNAVLSSVNASYLSRTNITPPSLCSVLVKDYIPLGGPTHHRVDDRRRVHSVPQSSSQGTNKKNEHTLKPLNPLVQCTPPPHKTFVHGGRDRSSTVFSAGPKKIIARSQRSPTNGIVPMRKVQFNNNIHLDNDRSCQSASKKNAPLQRKNSYVQEKEFALAFCKQLNENLKVTKRYFLDNVIFS